MKIAVCLDVASCSLIDVYQNTEEPASSICRVLPAMRSTLKMETEGSSETLEPIY
jgi:hypothetical protein